MLSTLVSRLKQPGDRIDVFLRPLIDDLQFLWKGVVVRDAVVNQHFTLHAMLMTTINIIWLIIICPGRAKGRVKVAPTLVRDMFLVAAELEQICIHGPQTMASKESPVPKHGQTV